MEIELAYLGHPILRKKAQAVGAIDQSILDLIRHMKEVVISHRGLGLAAPQVGAQMAILVACFPEPSDEGKIIPDRKSVV